MAQMEFVNAPSHRLGGLLEMGHYAARFTVMRKKIDICHLTDL